MGLTRFDSFLNRDYSWKEPDIKLFTPDFKMWDEALAAKQQGYDAATTLANKMPLFRDVDSELAQQYKQQAQANLQAITEAYAKNITEGTKAMKTFSNQLQNDWSSGGIAHTLETAYKTQAEKQKEIEDYYKSKDQRNSSNYAYALSQFDEQNKRSKIVKDSNGTYSFKGLNPEYHPVVDVRKEAADAIKEIKDSGTTSIVALNPGMYELIHKKGVTEETVNAVATEMLKQPKYQKQLAIDNWYQTRGLSDEYKQKIQDSYNKNQDTVFTQQTENLDKLLNSKNKQERMAAQEALSNLGYDVTINGVYDKESKEAFSKLKTDLKSKIEENKKNFNFENYNLEKNITEPIIKGLQKQFSHMDTEIKLADNKYWETLQKTSAQRQSANTIAAAIGKLAEPKLGQVALANDTGRQLESFDKQYETASSDYRAARGQFDKVLKQADIGLSNNSTDVLTAFDIYEHSKSADDFKKQLSSKFGLSGSELENVASKAFSYFNSPAANILKTSAKALQNTEASLDIIKNTQSSFNEDYANTPEGLKEIEKIKKQFPKIADKSNNEIVQMLTEKDPVFNYETARTYGKGVVVKETVNYADSFIDKRNRAVKANPKIATSARGTRFLAVANEGVIADLNKTIQEDIKNHNTLGYTSDGQAGIVFKDSKGNTVDAKPETIKLSPASDIGKSYFSVSATDKDGNPIHAIVDVQEKQIPIARQMAVTAYASAKNNNDEEGMRQAAQFYSNLSGTNPLYSSMNALKLNLNNTKQLNEVVNPEISKPGNLRSFGENSRVRGTQIGIDIERPGEGVYRKYKVYDPYTSNSEKYMLTKQGDDGKFYPIPISKGKSIYSKSIQDIDYYFTGKELSNSAGVEYNSSKYTEPTVNTQQLGTILGGLDSNN